MDENDAGGCGESSGRYPHFPRSVLGWYEGNKGMRDADLKATRQWGVFEKLMRN